MKKLLPVVLLMLSQFCYAQTDQKEISAIIAKQESDWNKNDMMAYANSFTEDGNLINFLGLFWKGKNEIITQFKLINDCCIKPTQIKFEITETKLLGDNAALVQIKETLTAKENYSVPGKVVEKGSIDHKLISAVFVKQKEVWKILSMQVTQIVPLPPR